MKKSKTTIMIFVIILLATILIGNPLVKNDNLINIIVGISGICVIIQSFKEKQTITNKTTKVMLMLIIISALPLIFNTFISLNGTINYIFRYISVFIMYIIVNQNLKENSENLSIIKNIIIISGIILVIFGIDLSTTNITYEFVKKTINATVEQETLTRMYSLFLYSNTFAITTVVAYLLSIDQMLNKKEKIYSGISTLLIFGIILSQSRITFFVLALIMLFYLIMLKNERKDFIKLILVNFIFGIIYATIFAYLKRIGYTGLIWILTLIFPVISSYSYNKLQQSQKINKIFKIKYLMILLILFIIFILVLSLFKSDLVMFNNENSQTFITKDIYDVKENNQYKMELDIEAKSNTTDNNFTIEFIQRSNYSDNIGEEKIELNNYTGIKEVDIDAKEGLKLIEFKITAKEVGNGNELKIKSLKINGKPFTLNYKFLPTDLISQVSHLDLSQRSVQERKVFVLDGFKIIKEYGILGIGGDGYKYVVKDVQSYNYGASQLHCYVLQIMIEFGLAGLLIFGYLMILTIKNIIYIIKKQEKEKYGIILAFIALFLHSLVDFDMTFLYTMIIFYTLISIINFNDTDKNNKDNKIINVIILLLISICTIFNVNELYVKLTKEEDLKNVKTYDEKTKLEKQYMYLVPYSDSYRMERIEYLNLYLKYKKDLSETEKEEIQKELVQLLKTSIKVEKKNNNIIYECIKIIENSNGDSDKELAYSKIEEMLKKHRYDASAIRSDYDQLKRLNDEKIQIIIDRNIDNSIKNVQDYNKCRITQQQSEEIIEQIKYSEKWRENFD